jgi:hypothetical protein
MNLQDKHRKEKGKHAGRRSPRKESLVASDIRQRMHSADVLKFFMQIETFPRLLTVPVPLVLDFPMEKNSTTCTGTTISCPSLAQSPKKNKVNTPTKNH